MSRVRVESKRLPFNATKDERDRESLALIRKFKRACDDYGIMHMIKENEFYDRPCDRRRRKKQQKTLAIFLAKEEKLP